MATISFYAGSTAINNLTGSGLGFFGGSFGQSVELNKWQDTTFITDGTGSNNAGSANNIKYYNATQGYAPNIVPPTGLKYIPNKNATCNIRFTNSSAVKTQNVRLRIFDRNNKDHAASGVTTRVAELLNPRLTYGLIEGSGDAKWWGDPTHDGTDVFSGMLVNNFILLSLADFFISILPIISDLNLYFFIIFLTLLRFFLSIMITIP